MRLRATIKLRNDKLLAAKEAWGGTIPALCAEAVRLYPQFGGVTTYAHAWYALVALDYSNAKDVERAEVFAAILGMAPEDIYPPALAGEKFDAVRTAIQDIPDEVLLATSRSLLALPSPVEVEETREAVENCLSILSHRERQIVEERYGLYGRKAFTLEELSERHGLSRERIRQVEQKAIVSMQKREDGLAAKEKLRR